VAVVLARQWRQLSDVALSAVGGDAGLVLALGGGTPSSPAEGIVDEIFGSRCIRKR